MPKALPVYFYLLLLCGLIMANISIYKVVLTPRNLEVTALEVGKGSATLVRTPDGRTILIDTGSDASILRALGTALPPWQRKIDAVVLTSTKKTSTGGLNDVLNRYHVAQQITITKSQRLALGSGASIDIAITKNAPAGVYVSDGKTTTKIR